MTETEIKIRVHYRAEFLQLLKDNGFECGKGRRFEENVIFDKGDEVISKGETVRLRFGSFKGCIMTHKTKRATGDLTVREETEVTVDCFERAKKFLEALGYVELFRYKRYRTTYRDGFGWCMLDETAIGDFAEFEGEAGWVRATIKKLGVEHLQEKRSYKELLH